MGGQMMDGEHLSMTEIYSYMPNLVPRPITWGKFQSASPATYFFLMEFLELGPILEPQEFCQLIAQLHATSTSPTGKFGFHQTTFQGPNAMNTTWESDWCTYFSRLLLDWLDREVAHNGPQPEYEAYYKRFVAKIVPRILEPLQSDGRILKPCLIHGDLWEENTGVNLATRKPVVFDACAMYAHNEMELGMWRNGRDRFGNPFFRQYLGLMPPSEPVEQFDDRNRVYAMKYALSHILGWPETSASGRQSYVISSILRHHVMKLTSFIEFGTICAT